MSLKFETHQLTDPSISCDEPVTDEEHSTKSISKFSNHSLVTLHPFLTSLTADKVRRRIPSSKSELVVTSSPTKIPLNVNKTLSLTECRKAIKPDEIKLSDYVDCEPPVTVMPNTNEFKGVNSIKSLKRHTIDSQKCVIPSSDYTMQLQPVFKSLTRSIKNWRIVLAVIWTLSLMTAIVFLTIAKKQNAVHEDKLILTPTNYEICLLIGRNVRRLIVSSIYSLRPQVK